MNESAKIIAYFVGDMRIPVQHNDKLVTWDMWASLVLEVKAECAYKCLLPLLSQMG